MNDSSYLDMKNAGHHLGQTYRWMQRHYPNLIKAGVSVYRIPAGSAKGRLMFRKDHLDRYMESCRVNYVDVEV